MKKICRHCGLPEDEHCAFEAIEMPEGCVCDPNEWGPDGTKKKPCSEFSSDSNGRCTICEHDKECHK